MDSLGQGAFSMPIKLLVVSELKDLSKSNLFSSEIKLSKILNNLHELSLSC